MLIWVSNVSRFPKDADDAASRMHLFVGPPCATEAMSEWDLINQGMIGLYINTGEVVSMTVINEIAAERLRQIEVKGFTADHDDRFVGGQLVGAAVSLALGPWDMTRMMMLKDRRRDLIRACALLVAEIERLDRKGKDT